MALAALHPAFWGTMQSTRGAHSFVLSILASFRGFRCSDLDAGFRL